MSTYRFMVGDITCIAILEGTGTANIQQRYPNATEDELNDVRSRFGIEGDTDTTYFNALYIQSGDTRILVDVGMGSRPERPDVGQLIPNLQSEGINPEDIDIVYITHFHVDHYLGLLTDGEATFPNARYVTLDDEWNFWTSEETAAQLGERLKGFTTIVDPLRDNFSALADGEEIVDGVKIVAMVGHTMGHSGLLIESGDESFLHMVDLLHHEAQFTYPEWQFVWDTDAELATQSRLDHLEAVANQGLSVMFYHLPFPGIGTVERNGAVYQWNPIES